MKNKVIQSEEFIIKYSVNHHQDYEKCYEVITDVCLMKYKTEGDYKHWERESILTASVHIIKISCDRLGSSALVRQLV